jgi:hypothetical protein
MESALDRAIRRAKRKLTPSQELYVVFQPDGIGFRSSDPASQAKTHVRPGTLRGVSATLLEWLLGVWKNPL